jgi:hypothetical protein
MVALGAFFYFAGKRIVGLVPADVVIPVLRAHFELVKYGLRSGKPDLFVEKEVELMKRLCCGGDVATISHR